MPGILAPQLNEAGGVSGAAQVPADTSLGEALTSFSNIFGAVAQEFGTDDRGTLTQTERDRAALQPFVDEALTIQQRRQSGSISPSEATIRMRKTFNNALSALPDKTDTIRNAFSTIAGEEFAAPSVDLETEQRNNVINWAVNTENPVGNLAFLESFTVDSEGNFDQEATMLKLQEKFFQTQASEARLEALRRKKEVATLTGEIDELEQAGVVDSFIAEASTKVQQGLEGVFATFPMMFPEGQGQTVGDRSDVVSRESAITELTALKSQYLNLFQSQAAQAGVLDNIEDKFEGGINTVVKPIDNAIAVLTRMSDEEMNTLKSMDARTKIQMLGLLREAGVPATTDTLKTEFWQNLWLGNFNTEIATVAANLKNNREAFRRGKVDEVMNSEDVTDEEGNPSAGVIQVTSELSTKEAINQVRTSVAKFKSLDSLKEETETSRRVAVNEFVVATETMNNRGAIVAEDTFDQIYDPRFFNVYNLVQVRGGPEATTLNKAVESNLSKLLAQRKFTANVSIQGALGNEFPSFSLVYNGEKFTMKNTNPNKKPKTILESRVFPLLKKHNLEFTFEGLKELRHLEIDQTPALGLNRFVGEIEDQLRYLNKIVGVAGKFPEEMRERILPSNQTQSVPTISTQKEYERLEDGQEYDLVLSNGSTRRFTKGNE